jgi:hypothetical protein
LSRASWSLSRDTFGGCSLLVLDRGEQCGRRVAVACMSGADAQAETAMAAQSMIFMLSPQLRLPLQGCPDVPLSIGAATIRHASE